PDVAVARCTLPPYDAWLGPFFLDFSRANKVHPPRPSFVTLSGHLTATLIGSGQFVGLLPSSVARFNASRAGLKILAMNLPAPRVATAIITVKNRTLSSLAKLFIECGRKVAAAITAPTKRKTLRSI